VASTRLSSKGQVIIPKHLRASYHWEAGQELIVTDTGEGILLTAKATFPKTNLNDVAGCLHYSGTAKTLDDMNEAIAEGLAAQFHDCN